MTASSKEGTSAWPLPLRFPTPRRFRTLQLLVFGALVLNIILSCLNLADHKLEQYISRWGEDKPELPYDAIPLNGYLNSGDLNLFECRDLAHNSGLEIQQSFHLHDDIFEIAKSLERHPMVDYEGVQQQLQHQRDEEGLSEDELVRRTWARFAQSSVWLEDQRLYLAVTRVIFYPSRQKDVPSISFIRGQIYDENWEELRNYTVNWRGEAIIFPRIFDIPAPYAPGDVWFGPEDPRIVIEEGVHGAEPVIIFNMISDLTAKAREMHAYRPFSGALNILRMEDKFDRTGLEKNWAPFFYRCSNPTRSRSAKRGPDHHLHFLYALRPFTVIRCNLLSGFCKRVYEEDLSQSGRHNDHPGRISGGTQFVPVRTDAIGTVSFVGFPRTHINSGCVRAMYRPELMVMTASDHAFHVDYVSSPIDFDDFGMDSSARADPCGEGRILIANSVARWERRTDTLTLTFSVDDMSTQAIRIRGVGRHVHSLRLEGLPDADDRGDGVQSSRSTIGQDVLGCSVSSAESYADGVAIAASFKGVDMLKMEAEREKKLKDLEDKIERFEEEKAEWETEWQKIKNDEEETAKGKQDNESTNREVAGREERLTTLNERIERLREMAKGKKTGEGRARQQGQQQLIIGKEDTEEEEGNREKRKGDSELERVERAKKANEDAEAEAERLRNVMYEAENQRRIESKTKNKEVEGKEEEKEKEKEDEDEKGRQNDEGNARAGEVVLDTKGSGDEN